ncbi:MAG: glycosyltransferase [Anaerolineaceae bacterium]|nr:glycosyltransferase [Anaerolineaceae bacterium]
MRVAHVITGLKIGGAEMMLSRLVREHKKIGIESIVFSLDSDGELKSVIQQLGIEVVDLRFSRNRLNLLGIWRLRNAIKEWNPDLIQCWMYHANLFGLISSKFAGNFPVLWNIRNSTLDSKTSSSITIFIMRVGAFLSSIPEKIITCSKIAQQVHVEIGYRESNFELVHNGFDTDVFAPDIHWRTEIRNTINVKEDEKVIGIIGRYDPQKDYSTFLHAVKILGNHSSMIHCILCGSSVDDQNAELMKLIELFGIQKQVHLLGYRADIKHIHQSLDILVSSSAYGEAFPNVIAEAMACGVPCVATDVGDSRFLIGDTGKVVPPRDPMALAQAIEDMLSLPQEDFKHLQAAARQRIVEHFSLPEIAKRYKKVYEGVINK